ncbi:MAG TPA: 30S ribosomal protein S12 methylthiotransferase RimO [Clostridia bacterium]|nr:MAG: Ribosomal protein S12 methylthiotransferase RimO [Firmicutes bacterium ADurb.Bin146]HOD92438.1 30S ribosomal protein S12 methylthiotransferase RimO [Clostridia bacterium]
MMKILINSLGCPKNLVDSEIIAKSLSDGGYNFTDNIENADAVVINTCSFIEPAVKEAIDVILDAARYKEKGSLKKIIVTGCLVERYKEQILDSIPEVDLCVGIDGYNDITSILKKTEKSVICGPKTDVSFMNKSRILSDNTASAYIKISEGCNNKCTYCTIPSIRGKFRSRTIDDIYQEVENLCVSNGIKEITLVAQDTTAYGIDIYGKPSLVNLLAKLETIKSLEWIRLLYCYPELISDELIEIMKNSTKILHYIDMPLQHSSDKVLKLMGRKGTYKEYTDLINKLRSKIPDIVIRTTFIVGFPQETEEDFENLCLFIKENRFDRAGFFEYSREPDTPAYKLKGQISKQVKAQRREVAENLQNSILLNKNDDRIGREYSIIIQGISEDGLFYVGRSYAEAYEIDPLIYISSKEPLNVKDIVNAVIVAKDDDSLFAEVVV